MLAKYDISMITIILSTLQFHMVTSLIVSKNPDDIHFYLYSSKSNPTESVELIYDKVASVPPGFSPEGPTRFIIHGFSGNSTYSSGGGGIAPDFLKNAYLASNEPGNTILVDWGLLSTPRGRDAIILRYPIVALHIPIVAKRIAQFITNYCQEGLIDPENVHLIGQSLGALGVVGEAGTETRKLSGIPVARITGLDPAGPLFDPPALAIKPGLSLKDALFVDVIHTNLGGLGGTATYGHLDFYPNGGSKQPGCVDSCPGGVSGCAHGYSYQLMAASISRPFRSCQCTRAEMGDTCLNSCKNPTYMGQFCPPAFT
ncbi:pancreatic lipase-related protein 2 isoform X2 [Folsomia candida]|uniref:pancreatic lipase-related protein 2 isoform X2 n=1 Tax=Folsomia candida TaxID=158441 RepID=UPI0016054D77|nr:pancreatic lipase-related protein 2 isoform X2 [Folsomia candida]